MPQAYTISAKPGVVNYVEGNAFVNGGTISAKTLKTTYLNANDQLSTGAGKAEVLLTPGVFLRVGENSQIRMVSPTLTDTQVEVQRGEAMVEVDQLVKDNRLVVLDHGSSITLAKTGLYRFTADNPPTAAVMEGKAVVRLGDRKVDLGKGRQTVIAENLKAEKFDTKKEDDLYAWSNVRSQYEAAASYQSARSIRVDNSGGWAGYGYSGFNGWSGPGWFWNAGIGSWAWLPWDGAFFSPFGWGFYSPGLIAYAPIVNAPVYRGGYWNNGRWVGQSVTAPVPVNASKPPAVGTVTRSVAANQAARTAATRSFSSTGFNTPSGVRVPAGRAAVPVTSAAGGSRGAGPAMSAPHSAPSAMPSGGGMHSAPSPSHR
jgi:hypothetical protein